MSKSTPWYLRRRQPRTGDLRRLQIYIELPLHRRIADMAREQEVSISRVAHQLLANALQTPNTPHVD